MLCGLWWKGALEDESFRSVLGEAAGGLDGVVPQWREVARFGIGAGGWA